MFSHSFSRLQTNAREHRSFPQNVFWKTSNFLENIFSPKVLWVEENCFPSQGRPQTFWSLRVELKKYVYVYVCLCVCMCMCMFMFMCMCICMYIYVYVHVCLCLCLCMCSVWVCMCIFMFMCMCICVYVYVHLYLCMFMYVCMFININIKHKHAYT